MAPKTIKTSTTKPNTCRRVGTMSIDVTSIVTEETSSVPAESAPSSAASEVGSTLEEDFPALPSTLRGNTNNIEAAETPRASAAETITEPETNTVEANTITIESVDANTNDNLTPANLEESNDNSGPEVDNTKDMTTKITNKFTNTDGANNLNLEGTIELEGPKQKRSPTPRR